MFWGYWSLMENIVNLSFGEDQSSLRRICLLLFHIFSLTFRGVALLNSWNQCGVAIFSEILNQEFRLFESLEYACIALITLNYRYLLFVVITKCTISIHRLL
jgi:hypothetical protein